MENANLKERVKNRIKEKIAISNIRNELEFNKLKNKNLTYLIVSSCAVFILCIGIVLSNINPVYEKPENVMLGNNNIGKTEGDLYTNDIIIFNQNVLNINTDIDSKWKKADLDKTFKFISKIDIPNEYNISTQAEIYVRDSIYDINYSKFKQYHVIYSVEGDNSSVEITFAKDNDILICTPTMLEHLNNSNSSVINEKEVKLFKTVNPEDKNKISGRAFFEHDGYKFYIDAYKINEIDFINVVKSILNQDID